MNRIPPAALVLLLAGSVILAASIPCYAQAQPSDATIQTNITSAIRGDSALQGQHITASVDNTGVVTLKGTVATEAQMQQASTDAANVAGVTGILNELKVTNPGAASNSQNSAGLAAQAAANQVSSQDQPEAQQAPQIVGQQPQQGDGTPQESAPPPPPDASQTSQYQQGPPQDASQTSQYQQGPPPVYGQGQPRPEYQQEYGYPQQQQPEVPYYATPSGPVTIPAGALLRVRLMEPLDSAHTQDGAYFQATAANDVYENGVLAIPRGAVLTGQVIDVKRSGELKGSEELRLHLTSINLGGKVFPLSTDIWSSKGPNKAGYTASNTAGGALLGAIIGGILGRGPGAAIGAGVGAMGGLAASSATKGPHIYLPTEAMVDFHLTNAVTVQPVSWQEAQRLASNAPRPVLMRRPRPRVYVMPGPYYGPYPYAYPYPYQ
ncbi:MAG TPA: BON domain-containing protein [Acidobacteriaceae bacterium]|nr:BON domain-containing protein [Acidobacteriaceae bacterium]